MAIPDFQSIMLPLLQFVADGQEYSQRAAVDALALTFKLTDEDLRELLPSGRQGRFFNRVGWARTYLLKAQLIASARRGYFQITQRGQKLLRTDPQLINTNFLTQYPEFQEFKNAQVVKQTTKNNLTPVIDLTTISQTPEEILDAAYQSLREDLASKVLELVKQCSPSFFERLTVDLLVRMGYGGSLQEAGQAIGRSGDEGIDGIINEDRLGLDVVYIQAKRWEGAVGRPEIQRFVGALAGKKARKGVFIATSKFTREAIDYAQSIDSKVVLVDGEMLSNLMLDYNIGFSVVNSYEIKQINTDYFTE